METLSWSIGRGARKLYCETFNEIVEIPLSRESCRLGEDYIEIRNTMNEFSSSSLLHLGFYDQTKICVQRYYRTFKSSNGLRVSARAHRTSSIWVTCYWIFITDRSERNELVKRHEATGYHPRTGPIVDRKLLRELKKKRLRNGGLDSLSRIIFLCASCVVNGNWNRPINMEICTPCTCTVHIWIELVNDLARCSSITSY